MSSSPSSTYEHWPLHNIKRNVQARLNKNDVNIAAAAAADETFYVLLSTGALNPVHRGHVAALDAIAEALEQVHKRRVVGTFLSPSSDCYLKSKFVGSTQDFFFPARVRHAAVAKALERSTLHAVGGFEVAHSDRWPDFPEVCDNLQSFLNANTQEIIGEEFSSSSPSSSPSPCRRIALKVIYCCGSDHYFKCGLTRGVAVSGGVVIPVAVTPRAGDKEISPPPSNNQQQNVFLVPPLRGKLAEISSTQIRAALATVVQFMHPAALTEVLARMSGDK